MINFNDSAPFRKPTVVPPIPVTNVTPSDNKHHEPTGTQVTVKQELW